MMARNRRAVSRSSPAGAEQRLGVALDGRERRAQLVRDVGDEVAPDHLQPTQLGDVVQHEHEAEGVAVGSRAAARRSPAA